MDPIYKELYPNLALIPDNILDGVDLSEEFNAYQLHRLYDIVGIDVIQKSVLRQREKYPESQLYVSTLRKRYKHRLPRNFYGDKPKSWCLYLLVTDDREKAKIGVSTNAHKRAFALSRGNPRQTQPAPMRFDLRASLIITGFKAKDDAFAAEAALKEQTLSTLCATPDWTPYFDARTEWRSYSNALEALFRTIASHDKTLILRRAIDHEDPSYSLLELLPLKGNGDV